MKIFKLVVLSLLVISMSACGQPAKKKVAAPGDQPFAASTLNAQNGTQQIPAGSDPLLGTYTGTVFNQDEGLSQPFTLTLSNEQVQGSTLMRANFVSSGEMGNLSFNQYVNGLQPWGNVTSSGYYLYGLQSLPQSIVDISADTQVSFVFAIALDRTMRFNATQSAFYIKDCVYGNMCSNIIMNVQFDRNIVKR